MVSINFNFSNKTFYTIIAVISILVLGGFVIAYNPSYSGAVPGSKASVMGHTADEIDGAVGGGSLTCPTGFTKITIQSQTLGCMQNSVQGTNGFNDAIKDCFAAYGGRLPGYSEAVISFSSSFSTITPPTTDELIDALATLGPSSNYCGYMIASNLLPANSYNGCSTPHNYRCFIPA